MLQWRKKLLIMITVLVVVLGDSYGQEAVSYDGKSLIIHGRRSILFSGSIHYPRSTPQMWPDLISKAKEGGLDVIQTYVFWNVHEPVKGMYNFNGRYDLVRFIKEVQGQGLYVSLRIGPFIEAEWTYGGLPFWLHDIPGIVYRSDNQPFKFYMEQFTRKIVNMMKSEKLYASQGGPIILSQIENEYQNVEARYGEMGTSYVKWAAQMAVSLDTGVPWVMCKQDDAPGPVINACNGMKCGETFAGPNSPSKPSIWTENWTSFVEEYGGEPYLRSAEDIAYAVTLFIIAKKGSFVNYYMYHGGTNFGRSAANYIKTSYYDQAPLDEYGMIRQPKWGHLKELHAAIKQCTPVLLWGSRSSFSLGAQQQGYVYQGSWGKCAAFLANNDPLNAATVNFRNSLYRLPPKSISILPDCKNVIFNTGWVNSHSNMRSITSSQRLYQGWERFTENLQNRPPSPFQSNGLSEQTSITKDKSDYLLYSTSYNYNGYPATFKLRVESLAHVVHAFINNHYAGNGHGTRRVGSFVFEISISLKEGINDISLLSVIVGLPNSGAHLESRYLGLRKVSLQNTNGETLDLSQYAWRYKIGMLGENLQLYKTEGLNKAIWIPLPSLIDRSSSPLTWFKTYFEAPAGNEPVVLNLASMSKGEAWINGESIGRYWVSFHTPKGVPSQSMYHIPRSFLNPSRNLLVIFEEMGGNPLHISIDTISNNRLCATVSESHSRFLPYTEKPTIQFQCPESKLISSVDFASFGTPFGACGEYKLGMCHSNSSRDIVHLACLGKTHCQIPVSIENLGDPCPGISKALSVEARCS